MLESSYRIALFFTISFLDSSAVFGDIVFEIPGPPDSGGFSPNRTQYHAQTFQLPSTQTVAAVQMPLGRDFATDAPFNVSIWEGTPSGILAGTTLLGTASIDMSEVTPEFATNYEELAFLTPISITAGQIHTIEFWTLSSDSYRIGGRLDNVYSEGEAYQRLDVLSGGTWVTANPPGRDYVFRLLNTAAVPEPTSGALLLPFASLFLLNRRRNAFSLRSSV